MGTIQSNTGLVTGMDIAGTVDKLMALAGKGRKLLEARTEAIKKEQVEVTMLSALLMSTRYVSDNLGKTEIFDKQSVASSNANTLAATISGTAVPGNYVYTPTRVAQKQQFLSSGFRSEADKVGAGTLTFRFGDHVERAVGVDALNGSAGITRGRIRITDRSGATAEIDLSKVQTIDDVAEAISANTTINVNAVVEGDHLRLVDRTGQAVSNLKVQEVGRGRTAASLGLDGIDVAATTADGTSVYRLSEDTDLSLVNDGRGIVANTVMADISYRLRDGSTGKIDLSPMTPGTSTATKETTLGQVLKAINAAAPGRLQAEIAPDGKRLVVKDLTTGTDAFSLGSLYDSAALKDLGLDGAAVGGEIVGRRILGGMKSVLLTSLNGGKGFGTLGAVEITDRRGISNTVNLAGAETLQDVTTAINAAGLGVTASVNEARTGIKLTDTTGASASNLIVANADLTKTATKLQIEMDGDVQSINSGDLHLQVVSENTLLADLNGGAGVPRGKITILDAAGRKGNLDLNRSNISTVGDVIRAVNQLGTSVQATINKNGDGIVLRDTSHDKGKLTVTDDGTGAANALHWNTGVAYETVNGLVDQVLDGSTTVRVNIASTDTLADLRIKINKLQAGVTAKTTYDGTTRPNRLSLTSDMSGRRGNLVIDTSAVSFDMEESIRGRDALLIVGAPAADGNNTIIASPDNQFNSVIAGMKLEVKEASNSPVMLTVTRSNTDVLANVKVFVENYNKFRKQLATDTAYDATLNKRGTLTGDNAALLLDTQISEVLSGRVVGAGSMQSLEEVGVGLNDDGTLMYTESKLTAAFARDPDAVKAFFTTEKAGFSAVFKKVTEELSGKDVSVLARRYKALDEKIKGNQDKLDFMQKRLDGQRERLLQKFYKMEIAVSKIQSNNTYLKSLQYAAASWSNPTGGSSSS